ncbi:MAG: HYR domain-containing protein, partial [Saprospiraceae bacterium]|nr:HYR domain-containing protein [Saprospiraceae bacterium]
MRIFLLLLFFAFACYFNPYAYANPVIVPSADHSSAVVMDTIPPEITCPPNIVLNLANGQCDTAYLYTVLVTDNEPNPLLIQLSGLASGQTLPLGTTVNQFLAADQASNTSTCSFSITVEKDTLPLICRDPFTIGLGAGCMRVLVPAQLMENAAEICQDNL